MQNKNKGKKITVQMSQMITRACNQRLAATSAMAGVDDDCTKLSADYPLSAEELAAGRKPVVLFQYLHGDALALIEGKQLKKRAYRLVFMDLPYDQWSSDQFDKCLTDVGLLNDSEYQTLVCFCGEDERTALMKVAAKHYDSLETAYWYKPNHLISGLNRHAKQIEVMFIAYKCTAEGVDGKRPATMFFKWDLEEKQPAKEKDDEAEDDEDEDDDDEDEPVQDEGRGCPNSNVFEFNKVTKLITGNNRNPVNVCQKPLALCQQLVYRFCIQGDWCLELCAGSASFSAACLRMSKNVVALDIDMRQQFEGMARLNACLHENVDLECGVKPTSDNEAEDEEEEEGQVAAEVEPTVTCTVDTNV